MEYPFRERLVRCVDNRSSSLPEPLLGLRGSIEDFVYGSRYSRSVDDLLDQLKILVLDIVSYCRYRGCDPIELFSLVLDCDEVMDSLKPLSNYTSLVRERVANTPRYMVLEPFLDVLLDKLLESRSRIPVTGEERVNRGEPLIVTDDSGRRWVKVRVDYLDDRVNGRNIGSRWSKHSWIQGRKVPRVKAVAVLVFVVLAGLGFLLHYSTRRDVYDSIYVSIHDEYLVLGVNGRGIPYGWIETTRTYHLTPYFVINDSAIVARYVFVSRSGSYAKFSLLDILGAVRENLDDSEVIVTILGSRVYVRCSLQNRSGSLLVSSCEKGSFIDFSITPFKTRSLSVLEAVYELVDQESIDHIRDVLFGNTTFSDQSEIAWFILDWLHENVEYGDSSRLLYPKFVPLLANYSDPSVRMLIIHYVARLNYTPDVLPPGLFLHVKKGTCRDYSLFTASALLAAGVREVYLIVFGVHGGEGHVTAGIVIDGVLYILDQKLPVVEWADYVEYFMSPSGRFLQVIKVTLESDGSLEIYAETVDPVDFNNRYPDSYPADLPPGDFALDLVNRIRARYGLNVSPGCSGLITISIDTGSSIHGKAYTPLFHRFMVEYFVDELASDPSLHQVLMESRCLWHSVEGSVIHLYLS